LCVIAVVGVPPIVRVVAAPPSDRLVVTVLKAANVASPTIEVTTVGVVSAGEVENTTLVDVVPVVPVAEVR